MWRRFVGGGGGAGEWAPPRSFTWVSRRGGITVTGLHLVEAAGEGRARVTLGIDQTGPLRRLFGPLTAALTADYIRREAEALRHRCESEIGRASCRERV